MKRFFGSLTVMAMAGVFASQASAVVIISFHSIGAHTVSVGTVGATDTTFFDAGSSTYAPLQLDYSYLAGSPSTLSPTSGTGTLTVVGGSIGFNFTGGVVGGASGIDALAGTIVTFTTGTGVLAGLSGTGQLSNTVFQTDPNQHRTTFEAALVPEPASMLALAVGAGVLARRRRNK